MQRALSAEYREIPSAQETHRPPQLWKGYTKVLVILHVPLISNKWI